MSTILHLDLDAFFCAVEELHDPSLTGKPFAVGGRPEERGVVASCSYAARAQGVRSAMPMGRALRQCPELIIVPPQRSRYSHMSQQVMDRLHNLAPLVEQISIDEAFVDISDLCPDSNISSRLKVESLDTFESVAAGIGRKIQRQIMDELGLPCSVGIASNKLVAKIATETGKKGARGSSAPAALTVIEAGREAEFLSPLPVSMLWGVGPKTEEKLSSLGIHTIGQLATAGAENLAALFGENGRQMWHHARGIDERPVSPEHTAKSISQETTFSRDISDDKTLERTLKELSVEVGKNLRREKLAGTTIKIKLRWPDFTTLTRQATLPAATDLDEEIFQTALGLLRKTREPGAPLRLVGVGVSGLGAPARQMELWGAQTEKQRKIQSVIDDLQARFGDSIIKKGR